LENHSRAVYKIGLYSIFHLASLAHDEIVARIS
jgi:hypothetical protein